MIVRSSIAPPVSYGRPGESFNSDLATDSASDSRPIHRGSTPRRSITTRPYSLRQLALLGRSGRRWYRIARVVLRRVADWHDWDYDTFADIVALTSPRCSVNRNLRVAFGYMKHRYLPPDTIRSTRIALGHYRLTGEIRGPKTGPFAAALKGDDEAMVLDSHMAAALGEEPKKVGTRQVQRSAHRRLARVANQLGWTMTETQAAIWCGYQRVQGWNPGRYDETDVLPF